MRHLNTILVLLLINVCIVSAQNITGPTTVNVGETHQYSFYNGTLYMSANWMTGYGTITSQWNIGNTYYATITWNTAISNAGLAFLGDFTMQGSTTVNINVGTPNTTFTITQNCGNTDVTRNTNPPAGVNWYWQTSSSGTSTSLGFAATINRTTTGSLWLRGRWGSSGSWSASSQSVGSISIVSTPPAVPASSTDGHRISNTAVTVPVSVTIVSGATSYRWYTQASGGTSIGGQTTTSYSPSLSSTQVYHVASAIQNCESTTRRQVTANVYPAPVITLSNGGVVPLGGQVTLSVDNFTYSTYQWLNSSGNPISGATSSSYATNVPGNYGVRVTKVSSPNFDSSPVTIVKGLQGQDLNYIVTNLIQVNNVTSVAAIENLPAESNMQSVQYFDGLGRPMQTVSTQGSPLKQDIIQPVAYDVYDREIKKFLPIVPGQNTGRYNGNMVTTSGDLTATALDFYDNPSDEIADDDRPFTETEFEVSPLNRPLKSYGPGKDWYDNNKYTESQTRVNEHGTSTGQEKIIIWEINGSGMPVRMTSLNSGFYPSGSLVITTAKDEQGNEVRSYTNKSGQMILKKVYVTGSITDVNNRLNWTQTYYIHDDLGNLRYVLQPELVKTITANDTSVPSQAQLDGFAFQYRFDSRNRPVQTRVPGADWVYAVYDKRDRIVLTQDGKQRTPRYWTFTKYDELNRPILTGIKDTSVTLTQAQMQSAVDAHYAKAWTKLYETYIGSATGNVHGYSNKSYPVFTSAAILDVNHYVSVAYYDNYNFKSLWYGDYDYVNDGLSKTVNNITYTQPTTELTRVNGLPTGAKVKVLDGGVRGGYMWLKSVTYYDEKYRVIQNIADNLSGGDRISTLYDFTGKMLKSKTTHVYQPLTWTDRAGVDVAGNSIVRTLGGNGWGTSGAASAQMLPASTDGWVEFTPAINARALMVGFSESNANAHWNTIKYALYLTASGTLEVRENGGATNYLGSGYTYQAGDVFRIERMQGNINYYQNGTLLLQRTAVTNALLADLSFYSGTAEIINVKCSFGLNEKSSITRTNEYDHAGRPLSTTHSIGEPITWTNLTSVQVNDNTITKTSATAWDGGASSAQVIPASTDGWVEFTPDNTTTYRMLGLSDQDVNAHYNTIDFAIYTYGDGILYVFENGSNMGSYGPYVAGDVLRIERRNGTIYYKKNGETLHFNNANSTVPLYADASIYDQGATIAHAYIGWKPDIQISSFEYNELGQPVTKKLHSDDGGTTHKQSIDYLYNIRGWLNTINDPDAPETGDLFSMKLNYNTPTANGGTAQYNGNISEVVWASAGGDKQSYGFSYDPLNRLIEGKYYNIIRSAHNGRYNEKIGDPSLSIDGYDFNGNIKRLWRYGKKDATTFGLMDDLTYTYTANSNKLHRVDDAIATGTGEDGFTELVETINEYTYDVNGNMIKDSNKGVTAITYSFLNLPDKISKSATDYVVYVYDAAGRKLSQHLYGTAPKSTSYSGEYVYENDTLRFIIHEEGRVVPDTAQSATQPWEYQYFLKDHLGNTRVTFSEKTTTTEYKATLEDATQTYEQNTFSHYSRSSINSPVAYNHTPSGNYSQLLHGGFNSQVGLAKSFEVNPGDVFDLEVFAKYQNLSSNSSNYTALFSALVSAFSLNSSGGPGLDGQQAYNAFDNMFSAAPYIETNLDDDDTAPKAYLNYILFDLDFNLLDFGFDQIDASADQSSTHDYLSLHVKVSQPGYLYIYLSNENTTLVDVFFDDLKIVHHSGVEQLAEYYPFGLQVNSNSFQRSGSAKQNYLYNGKEKQDELDLGWLDYGARMYMPEIGRWGVVDPLSEKANDWTPYRYGFNNPIGVTDPTGMFEESPRKIVDEERMLAKEVKDLLSTPEQYVKGGYGESIPVSDVAYHSGETHTIGQKDEQDDIYQRALEFAVESLKQIAEKDAEANFVNKVIEEGSWNPNNRKLKYYRRMKGYKLNVLSMTASGHRKRVSADTKQIVGRSNYFGMDKTYTSDLLRDKYSVSRFQIYYNPAFEGSVSEVETFDNLSKYGGGDGLRGGPAIILSGNGTHRLIFIFDSIKSRNQFFDSYYKIHYNNYWFKMDFELHPKIEK